MNYNIKSIAFPAISTGAYGYPVKEAIIIVFSAVIDFLDSNESIDNIEFVLHNDEIFMVYNEYFTQNLGIL